MTIYIDVVILENLVMNYIILYATGIVTKSKINHIRIIIASLIGAIYAVIEYWSKITIYSNITIKLILSIIIIYVAFNPQNIKKMCKDLLLLYLTTFTFGGAATYLIYVVKPQNVIIKNGTYVGSYILKIVFLGGILGSIIIITAFKIVKNKLSKKDMYCKIKIELNGKELILNTMIDTGNMLKEPISGLPVVVIEHTKLYNIIPKEILNNIETILGGDFDKIPKHIKEQYMSKLKVIPFASLGKQNGMLLGIKTEKIEIMEETNKKNREAIIGIYNKSLTKKGEYNALIGIDLYQ